MDGQYLHIVSDSDDSIPMDNDGDFEENDHVRPTGKGQGKASRTPKGKEKKKGKTQDVRNAILICLHTFDIRCSSPTLGKLRISDPGMMFRKTIVVIFKAP